MKNIPPTFDKLAERILNDDLTAGSHWGAKRIDFISDCYPTKSIKDSERNRLASAGAQRIQIIRADQNTPKKYFKKYL